MGQYTNKGLYENNIVEQKEKLIQRILNKMKLDKSFNNKSLPQN